MTTCDTLQHLQVSGLEHIPPPLRFLLHWSRFCGTTVTRCIRRSEPQCPTSANLPLRLSFFIASQSFSITTTRPLASWLPPPLAICSDRERTSHPEILLQFLTLLSDMNDDVRVAAAFVLEHLGTRAATPDILRALTYQRGSRRR